MSLPRHFSGLAIAAVLAVGGLMSASSAKAEDLVDFLWGGSPEYGGGRSVVSFDPKYKPGQVIVSFSDRRLYWITKTGEALTYPVAIPTGEARWQGVTSVTNKRVNPSWTPTPEMVRNNPRLPRWVPGGHPMNPLGIRAMYLGSSAYRIHGTDAPWTIGQAVSHGCIRMTNEDVLDLYPRVPVGTRVTVTWQQFSTKTISSGDSYGRYGDRDSNPRATAAAASSTPAVKPSNGGGLASLFFWDDAPKSSPVPVASGGASDQAGARTLSRDATRDDDSDGVIVVGTEPRVMAEEPAEKASAPTSKKASSHETSAAAEPAKSAEKSAEKSSPAKTASTAAPKKKPAPAAATAAARTPPVDPVMDPSGMAVPDPVKPSAVSTSANQASSSASEGLPVHKASMQVE
jgi:lipoprotein-anchoring transpeptidase ErfK/SrfK